MTHKQCNNDKIIALTITILVAFVWGCPRAFSQSRSACQDDLQHLTLPQRALIDDVVLQSNPPLSLLFSQDGVAVYSATDYKAEELLFQDGSLKTESLTLIDVFQSEQARQRSIKEFERFYGVQENWHAPDSPAIVENLKFHVFRFELRPVWIGNVLEREWLMTGDAYFEPYSCVPPRLRGFSAQYGPVLCASAAYCPNTILGMMPPGGERRAVLPQNPIVLKALRMMRSKLAAYGLPN